MTQVEQHRHPRLAAAHLAGPEATAESVEAVTQLLALVGHARDNGAADLLVSIFTPDVVLDDAGEISSGLVAVAEAFDARRDEVSHHTVNTVVRQSQHSPDELVAWSRQITITADGAVATADVLDRIVGGPGSWRVARRIVRPRHGGAPPQGDLESWWG
jgi:SnoaL-like protein